MTSVNNADLIGANDTNCIGLGMANVMNLSPEENAVVIVATNGMNSPNSAGADL